MVAYQKLTQLDIGNLVSEFVILILLKWYFFLAVLENKSAAEAAGPLETAKLFK